MKTLFLINCIKESGSFETESRGATVIYIYVTLMTSYLGVYCLQSIIVSYFHVTPSTKISHHLENNILLITEWLLRCHVHSHYFLHDFIRYTTGLLHLLPPQLVVIRLIPITTWHVNTSVNYELWREFGILSNILYSHRNERICRYWFYKRKTWKLFVYLLWELHVSSTLHRLPLITGISRRNENQLSLN